MHKITLLVAIWLLANCSGRQSASDDEKNTDTLSFMRPANSFADDWQFLQKYHNDLVELREGNARALVCPAYQGRVMTSTADGETSYGWINYELIRSQKLLPHMNAYGGEDRFWLGPEGGQYGLFFKQGDPFDGDHWQTPAAIDSEPFVLKKQTTTSATFGRSVELTNYSGTQFAIDIERTVTLLPGAETSSQLGLSADSLTVVGIRSDNAIINKGKQVWTPKTGLPSIWILGMMNASPQTTVIVPFRKGPGQPINDAYFGKVPTERLAIGETSALFTADAAYRAKIGVSPERATSWVGSYNSATNTLTLVTFDFDPANRQYVNSAWEMQKQPYSGDVLNAYNDGPMKPGQGQMGTFYELESSSPAAKLTPGQRLTHRHTTFHVQGPYQQLNALARRLLLTDLSALKSATPN